MRIGSSKVNGSPTTTYSPDDGDYQGFLALSREWAEQYAVPIRETDLLRFAQFWAALPKADLRTPSGWAQAMRKMIRSKR